MCTMIQYSKSNFCKEKGNGYLTRVGINEIKHIPSNFTHNYDLLYSKKLKLE